jgi:hypothetical protein
MFWILHLAALIFFAPALFVTIPLHLLRNSVERRNTTPQKPRN